MSEPTKSESLSKDQQTTVEGGLPLPIFIPLAFLIFATVLAMVDTVILADVVGKVLDLESSLSYAIAATLGLVGISFMMHLGFEEAESKAPLSQLSVGLHYGLWIAMGLTVASLRLFSSYILDLSAEAEAGLVQVLGMELRSEDLVFAPLMLILYLMTGLAAKKSMYSLISNPEFQDWRGALKARKSQREKEKEDRKKLAKQRQVELEKLKREKAEETAMVATKERDLKRQEKEAKRQEKAAEAQARREAMEQEAEVKRQEKEAEAQARREDAERARAIRLEDEEKQRSRMLEKSQLDDLRAAYHNELTRHGQLAANFKNSYQEIVDILSEVEAIDGEIQATNHKYKNTNATILKSERTAQQHAAFEIQGRTGASAGDLKVIIETHNSKIGKRQADAKE